MAWRTILSLVWLVAGGAVAQQFQRASFVSPAAPSIVNVIKNNGGRHVLHGAGVLKPTTALWAKKPKANKAVKGGKIQVKLLKYIEGTGSVGDVVMVSPAFYENKLKKTKSAVPITDEQVLKETAEAENKEAESKDAALELCANLEELESLEIQRKSGPDGHLFGGVQQKHILEELKKAFPKHESMLSAKHVKLASIMDAEGNDVGHDIKNLGEYAAKLHILKDVEAEFKVSVLQQK
jgi:large subunit ribosomal protein L9|uniref:50S ribosomal protein L9, chloroplastic n=1 Tax=Attheya septentrionalis TaxID=420275 RepID=A0A6T7F495_9STRA|mmetsp:Transcript_1302/g.2342  ORF Transcript_1302/g.2342 Transcript_1302/m.2342 type:complete len:237 (+) Transcript_1302:134-844(+)|eukprot:CAMPEP_0198282238 /NCGR_PEP_ID=MMETSP1449-20131203/2081_1 /TAXON_ID=420275 /ORGANISM="Attheya septentrionalis, Strain CCMP2084" /LENGTH=236 /DNA_ID=CAMNT_0043978405 /DNA_START=82 /DNA_END=792 /DNA_ORIENTATION=-